MHIFLFHVCASAEHLLGLVVEDNSPQDHVVVYVISLAGAHSSLGPGWNIAAELRDILLNNTGYLSSSENVQYIPFKFFHFLSVCCFH